MSRPALPSNLLLISPRYHTSCSIIFISDRRVPRDYLASYDHMGIVVPTRIKGT